MTILDDAENRELIVAVLQAAAKQYRKMAHSGEVKGGHVTVLIEDAERAESIIEELESYE